MDGCCCSTSVGIETVKACWLASVCGIWPAAMGSVLCDSACAVSRVMSIWTVVDTHARTRTREGRKGQTEALSSLVSGGLCHEMGLEG